MAREELKTIEGWHKSGCNSWDEYCKPGDMVDQGVADYFLDILPPRTMTRDYFQVGEPHSHEEAGKVEEKEHEQSKKHDNRESERRDWRQSWKASTANLRRRKMRDE